MHIGMVAGVLFFCFRLGLVIIPGLALQWPVKKIAAVAALLGVVLYTWLVGSPVPAQRATLMTGLVLLGILLDRVSISLRAIALAAGLLLLMHPSSLLHPGFQLSFAAMALLIGYYEQQQRQAPEETKQSRLFKVWGGTKALVLTSLLAALATAPLGLYHFHRLQLLGVLGNLIAVPLTGLVVMPASVLSYVLLPFGLAEWPIRVMGWGVEGITDSAAIVASLPGANIIGPNITLATLLLFTFAGLWAVIWQGKVRALAMLPVLLALPLIYFHQKPIVLLADEGLWAVRGYDNRLYFGAANRLRLTASDWQRTYSKEVKPRLAKHAKPESGLRCEGDWCHIDLAGQHLALTMDRDGNDLPCPAEADWIIAPLMYIENCTAPNIIDRRRLKEQGSIALYEDKTGLIVTATRSTTPRPWERGGAGGL
jgi:competence protein ComEC